MKCEKCAVNEATVFYREIINGKETKMHLCSKCAGEKEAGFGFGDLTPEGLFGNVFSSLGLQKKPSVEAKRCSLCGSLFSDIAKMGKVGCPKCYESFADELAPTLKRLHGVATHKGNIPEKHKEKLSALRYAEQLEAELEAAVSREEYEKAAELRDKIRELRGGEGK